jgi:hypothetical protein
MFKIELKRFFDHIVATIISLTNRHKPSARTFQSGFLAHGRESRFVASLTQYHMVSRLWVGFQWLGLPAARAIGRTESERTPWAPWMSTPSISAVADGPVWKLA